MEKVAKKLELYFLNCHDGFLDRADRKKQGQTLYLDLLLSLGWGLLFLGSGPFSFLPSRYSQGKRGSQGSTSKEANSKIPRSQVANANVRWQVLDNREQWGLW